MKTYEILTNRLYMSGHPNKRSNVMETVAELGVTIIVTLATQSIKPGVVDTEVVKVVDRPMPDGKYPDVEKWNDLASYVHLQLMNKEVVLIHCNAGRNRAGLLATMVYARYCRVSPQYALNRVRAIRPRAVANPAFEAHVLGL